MTEIDTEVPIARLGSNCVLVAMKKVSDLPDSIIVKAAYEHGFDQNFGMYTNNIPFLAKDLGLGLKDHLPALKEMTKTFMQVGAGVSYSRNLPTLKKIATKFNKGVYVVCVPNHCLTLIDGKIIDPNCPDKNQARRVLRLWKIERLTLVPNNIKLNRLKER